MDIFFSFWGQKLKKHKTVQQYHRQLTIRFNSKFKLKREDGGFSVSFGKVKSTSYDVLVLLLLEKCYEGKIYSFYHFRK